MSSPTVPMAHPARGVDWDTVVAENVYINTKKASRKDAHSYCSLVDVPLTQSENIALGDCMESLFHDVVAKNGSYEDIDKNKCKNAKGTIQKDHIWLNTATRTILYAEQKNNINLDTEKCAATKNKIAATAKTIAKEYPDYTISVYLFAARYLRASEPLAQNIIQKKYAGTTVLGVNDYLELFGLSGFADYAAYKRIIRSIACRKFYTAAPPATS